MIKKRSLCVITYAFGKGNQILQGVQLKLHAAGVTRGLAATVIGRIKENLINKGLSLLKSHTRF